MKSWKKTENNGGKRTLTNSKCARIHPNFRRFVYEYISRIQLQTA